LYVFVAPIDNPDHNKWFDRANVKIDKESFILTLKLREKAQNFVFGTDKAKMVDFLSKVPGDLMNHDSLLYQFQQTKIGNEIIS